jgi:hypothetical protein
MVTSRARCDDGPQREPRPVPFATSELRRAAASPRQLVDLRTRVEKNLAASLAALPNPTPGNIEFCKEHAFAEALLDFIAANRGYSRWVRESARHMYRQHIETALLCGFLPRSGRELRKFFLRRVLRSLAYAVTEGRPFPL